MPRHRIRDLGLLLAVWALLLAPGALGSQGDAATDVPDSEHLAAAILAPTMGSESFLGSRPCDPVSDDVDQTCAVLGGPVSAVGMAVIGLWAMALLGPSVVPAGAAGRAFPPRAPPSF